MKWYFILTLMCLIIFMPLSSVSDEIAIEKRFIPPDQPIHIISDKMEADRKKDTISFTGNVIIQQGDLYIYSENVTAIYENGKRIKEIFAKGSVRLVKGDRIASSEEALFNNTQRTVLLVGNAKVWQGKNVITGERILYYIDEDKSIVEGKKGQRVKATIYPPEKGK